MYPILTFRTNQFYRQFIYKIQYDRLHSRLSLCVQVSLPEAEVKAGLALLPQALEISLVDQPLTDLLFTQFMASVSGKVYCLGKASILYT